MKAKILNSIMGVLAFDDNNQLIAKVFFEKNAEVVAEKILKTETGEVITELELLLKKLVSSGYDEFFLENPETAKNVRGEFNLQMESIKLSPAEMLLSKSMSQFAIDEKFMETEQEYREWVHDVSVALTKKRVRKAGEKRDLMVAQAILSIDDIDKTTNLFMSRIREWYGLHFPELDSLLERHETYARVVLNLRVRNNFTTEDLQKEGLPKDKAEQIVKASLSSMGAELREEDTRRIQEVCQTTLELYELRQKLETHIDQTMTEVAPNINALVGSLLGARLIAIAGGLGNLAKMPASTIQVLGAEKALFRALKTGARPPKHGLLFQHAFIHEATRWQRGKVARALAGKLAIAARIDAYGGNYVGDKLKADLEKRVKDIQEKYAKPPLALPTTQWQKPREERQQRRFKRDRRR